MPSKNGGSGGEIAVVGPDKTNELDTFTADEIKNEMIRVLGEEVSALEGYDFSEGPEIKAACKTWLLLYHALDYLSAALQLPDSYETINRDDENNYIWKYGHRVPAFTLGAEGGQEGEEGWFALPQATGGVYTEYERRYSEENLNTVVQNLSIASVVFYLKQITGVNHVNRPLLQSFLIRFKDFVPIQDEFHSSNPADWLNDCYRSIPELTTPDIYHENTQFYVKQFLKRIEQLWGSEINSQLNQVRNWLATAELSSDDFEIELKRKLPIGQIEAGINSGNNRVKLEIGKMNQLLYINKFTFEHIYRRCEGQPDMEDVSHCLEMIVKRMKSYLPDDYHQGWDNLTFATYGAIIWQMIQQINRTVKEIS